MKIISLNNVPKTKVTMSGAIGATKQIPLAAEDGAPVYAYRVFSLDANGYTPFHQHPYEHMNYVIEGEGFLVNEKGEQQPIKKGDFALVLPNEKHQYRNASATEKFVMICGVPKEFQ
jgi:quercetin dioxygenase-like cupin family protein